MAEITYADAGVDIEEGAAAVDAIKDAVHSTYRPEVVGDIGGFGGLFSAAAFKGMEEPLMVSGTDGVGTKLKVAQLIGKHDTVGIDLVAMCVNDILDTRSKKFKALKKSPKAVWPLRILTLHLFSFGLLIFSGRLF